MGSKPTLHWVKPNLFLTVIFGNPFSYFSVKCRFYSITSNSYRSSGQFHCSSINTTHALTYRASHPVSFSRLNNTWLHGVGSALWGKESLVFRKKDNFKRYRQNQFKRSPPLGRHTIRTGKSLWVFKTLLTLSPARAVDSKIRLFLQFYYARPL